MTTAARRRRSWRLEGGTDIESILQTHRPLVVVASAVTPLIAAGILALFRDGIANTNAALVLLLLVGAAVTEIALWGRREQARASREQGYLDGVLGTAATVAAGRSSITDLIDRVCQQIVEILQIDGARFDADTRSGRPVLDPTGTVTRAGRTINVPRQGLPADTKIALMVQSGGVSRGHLELTAATRVVRPSRQQLRVAVTLANQLGAALATPPA